MAQPVSHQVTFTLPPFLETAFQKIKNSLPEIQTAVIDTATKVINYMKSHPYITLSATLALSLITMSPWISYKWLVHAIAINAIDVLDNLSYLFIAHLVYNIVQEKDLFEPSRNLLLSSAAINILSLVGTHYYWWFPPVFKTVSNTLTTLGIIAAGYLAQNALSSLPVDAEHSSPARAAAARQEPAEAQSLARVNL